MARRLNLGNAGNYSNGGGTEFFRLEDDGDVAKVRLLYAEPDGSDLDYYLVHQVEIGGKKRYVSCLAVQDDDTIDTHKCPLCQAGNPRQEKLFLQLYNEDEDKLQLWERGRNFIPKVQSLINRYKCLVAQPIEVERNGKKNSQSTTYSFYPSSSDGKTLDDFPEKQDLTEKFIIDASESDMNDILNGSYRLPGDSSNQSTERRERRSERGERPQRPSRPTNQDVY